MGLFDIFISYGREDSKAFAIELNRQLTEQGLITWFDQEDIPLAVDYQKQINTGIEKAHNFIFIIAPRSINSPYCLKEIELAIKLNKRIIPLLHVEEISQEIWQERNPKETKEDWQEYQSKGLHSSEQNMNPTIKKLNWVYFRENDNFETSFSGLLEIIDRHKGYVDHHTNLLVRALEWEHNQKQTNYLLIGEERQNAENWLKEKFSNEQSPCIPTDLHCEFICESVKNANNLMTQVFLSYSEKDRDIKEKIRKTLMRESLTVWTNKTDIKTGVAFSEEINKGIEGADNFIYLMSSDSLKSEYCQQELKHANSNNKRIIPLLIEEVKSELIPVELKGLQFIDFTKAENKEQYQTAINKLLGELKKDTSYYEKHKILLVKALKWQGQNENLSLLLRGYNLQQFEAWLKVAKQNKDYPPLSLQEEFIAASLNRTEESSLEVFISYSRSDSDLARKINEKLQELGKNTWFDQESIATGTDFKQEIYRGIESSDNFLFIISPKSVNSPYCADEVEYAQSLNKRFVTILHRSLSEEDRRKQPSALASVQYLDFNQHGGDFGANFNELVRTLDTDRDHVRNHTKWSQRALEWNDNKKGTDLLLRGSEFAVAEVWLKTAEAEQKKPTATDLQKEFIAKSREAIEARKKQDKRQILILRSLLVEASVALVAAIGGGIFALINQQEAKTQAKNAEEQATKAENAREDALKSEQETKKQEEIAIQQKLKAEDASKQALLSEQKAKNQANIAIQEKQKAEDASKQALLSEQKAKNQANIAIQEKQKAEAATKKARIARKQARKNEKKATNAYINVLKELSLNDMISKESIAGEVKVLDNDPAWIPLSKPEGKIFSMLRPYGKGKVFAAGHDGVLKDEHKNFSLLRSSLGWLNLSNDNDKMNILISIGYCEIISSEGSTFAPPLSGVKEQMEKWGAIVKDIAAPIDETKLREANILIIGNAWGNFTQSEIDAVENFVKNGGNLFVVRIGWSWRDNSKRTDIDISCKPEQQTGQNIEDISTYPMNHLVEPYKMQWTEEAQSFGIEQEEQLPAP
jgi:hypothetical protein